MPDSAFRRRSRQPAGELGRGASGWRKLAAVVGLVLLVAAIAAAASGDPISVVTARWQIAVRAGVDRARVARIDEVFEREMRVVLEHPAFAAHLAQRPAAAGVDDDARRAAAVQALVARGASRLDDEAVVTLTRLHAKILHASDRACACEADPSRCSVADVIAGLAALSDSELQVYARTRAKAGTAELDAKRPLAGHDEEAIALGLSAVMDLMSDAEGDKLLRVWRRPEDAAASDRCSVMRALYGAVELLETTDQARFARAVAGMNARR